MSDPLRTLCERFIAAHRISEASSMGDNDKVIEHLYGFIHEICKLVGFSMYSDESDWKERVLEQIDRYQRLENARMLAHVDRGDPLVDEDLDD